MVMGPRDIANRVELNKAEVFYDLQQVQRARGRFCQTLRV